MTTTQATETRTATRTARTPNDVDVVGRTYRIRNLGPTGGGPEKSYWTVLETSTRRISSREDNTLAGQTVITSIVRPATDDESAPVAAKIAARAAKIVPNL